MAILEWYGLDFERSPVSGRLYVVRSIRTDEPVDGRLELLRFDDSDPPVEVDSVTIEASGVTPISQVALSFGFYPSGRMWLFYARANDLRYRESADGGNTWSAEETPASGWVTGVSVLAAVYDPPRGRFIVITNAGMIVGRRETGGAWTVGGPTLLESTGVALHGFTPKQLQWLPDGSINYTAGGRIVRFTQIYDDATYERAPIIAPNDSQGQHVLSAVDPRTGVMCQISGFGRAVFISPTPPPPEPPAFADIRWYYRGGRLKDDGSWELTGPLGGGGPGDEGHIAMGGGNWPELHSVGRVKVRRDGVFEFAYVPFAGPNGTLGELGWLRSNRTKSDGHHRFE